ncbi:2740_t:CDS:2 [Acaulospora colombiana]|uniref:2740_t:CDS:1 n=1 Tax=Acaulospora colombiana TaxID=27376 RepID=A0ACA9N0M6_9GLOM|nr:2740_t:CDS:2 [Acaulospora colombiana]
MRTKVEELDSKLRQELGGILYRQRGDVLPESGISGPLSVAQRWKRARREKAPASDELNWLVEFGLRN